MQFPVSGIAATIGDLSQPAWLALVGVAVALGATTAILIFGVVRSRRRLGHEVRTIVQVVEEMRSGKGRHRAEVGDSSPLGSVADAVNRLGHELHSRWSEADSTAERWRALIDASEDIAVITTDTDGDIRSFSTGATNLFGWDEDEVNAWIERRVEEAQAHASMHVNKAPEEIGISPEELQPFIDSGELPTYQLGRHQLVKKTVLAAFQKNHAATLKGEPA